MTIHPLLRVVLSQGPTHPGMAIEYTPFRVHSVYKGKCFAPEVLTADGVFEMFADGTLRILSSFPTSCSCSLPYRRGGFEEIDLSAGSKTKNRRGLVGTISRIF